MRAMVFRQIDWIEPVEAADRLQGLPALSFLDSAMGHPTLGRFSYLAADPFGVFTVRHGTAYWNGVGEVGAPLDALRTRLHASHSDPIDGLPPFQGGAIGRFAYEWGWALEGRVPPHPSRCSDIHLAFYDVVVAFDHVTERCWVVAACQPEATQAGRRRQAESRLDAMTARLARPAPRLDSSLAHVVWRPTMSRATYHAAVERVKSYIRDGDIYQANIAQRFVAEMPERATPWQIYRLLRKNNPAPFAAYIDEGRATVLSTSPELFLRVDGRRVETRPIKGTLRRDGDSQADHRAGATLLASRKDRAENVMIVDLLRNDLSRVCEPDSVRVPVLCGLESYAGLHHLVSAVTGTLRDDADMIDLVAASFPGGSITGAPKLRAMEIIAEIEGRSRGVYCGAIGALGFEGSLHLNIAIRTLVAEGHALELSAGGGITILSDPDREYEETIVKSQRIFDALAPARATADVFA